MCSLLCFWDVSMHVPYLNCFLRALPPLKQLTESINLVPFYSSQIIKCYIGIQVNWPACSVPDTHMGPPECGVRTCLPQPGPPHHSRKPHSYCLRLKLWLSLSSVSSHSKPSLCWILSEGLASSHAPETWVLWEERASQLVTTGNADINSFGNFGAS